MSKRKIKEILREGGEINIKGFGITRPTQKLIVMRGVSGGGKSTEAAKRVGEGIIHSTDTLIENAGNYNEFFAKMIESKDFSPLQRMHSQNFKNALASMKEGISPIVIDNTNLKANEPKDIIEAALRHGYDENNIEFVDVGTGGLTAEELAARNSHGVPLDKIKMMIETYEKTGELTVEKVVKAKPMF